MRYLFGAARYESEFSKSSASDRLRLHSKIIYRAPTLVPSLDFLEIKGKFSWLQPEEWLGAGNSSGGISCARFQQLQQMARILDVKLPKAFERFMTESALLRNFLWTTRSVLADAHGLTRLQEELFLKCPGDVDRGSGGIVLQICPRGRRVGYFLYLDPGKEKGHCVLKSQGNDGGILSKKLQRRRKKERKEVEKMGLKLAELDPDRTVMVATSYEEFLAILYFEYRLLGLRERLTLDRSHTKGLREYVENVYVKEELGKSAPEMVSRYSGEKDQSWLWRTVERFFPKGRD